MRKSKLHQPTQKIKIKLKASPFNSKIRLFAMAQTPADILKGINRGNYTRNSNSKEGLVPLDLSLMSNALSNLHNDIENLFGKNNEENKDQEIQDSELFKALLPLSKKYSSSQFFNDKIKENDFSNDDDFSNDKDKNNNYSSDDKQKNNKDNSDVLDEKSEKSDKNKNNNDNSDILNEKSPKSDKNKDHNDSNNNFLGNKSSNNNQNQKSNKNDFLNNKGQNKGQFQDDYFNFLSDKPKHFSPNAPYKSSFKAKPSGYRNRRNSLTSRNPLPVISFSHHSRSNSTSNFNPNRKLKNSPFKKAVFPDEISREKPKFNNLFTQKLIQKKPDSPNDDQNGTRGKESSFKEKDIKSDTRPSAEENSKNDFNNQNIDDFVEEEEEPDFNESNSAKPKPEFADKNESEGGKFNPDSNQDEIDNFGSASRQSLDANRRNKVDDNEKSRDSDFKLPSTNSKDSQKNKMKPELSGDGNRIDDENDQKFTERNPFNDNNKEANKNRFDGDKSDQNMPKESFEKSNDQRSFDHSFDGNENQDKTDKNNQLLNEKTKGNNENDEIKSFNGKSDENQIFDDNMLSDEKEKQDVSIDNDKSIDRMKNEKDKINEDNKLINDDNEQKQSLINNDNLEENQLHNGENENHPNDKQNENKLNDKENQNPFEDKENENELNSKQNANQLNDKENENQLNDKENENKFNDKENENQLNDKENKNKFSGKENENQFEDKENENELNSKQNANQLNENKLNDKENEYQFNGKKDENKFNDKENENELNEKQNENQLNENHLNDKENDNQFKDKENETQFKDKENENELNEKQNENQLNENHLNDKENENQFNDKKDENKFIDKENENLFKDKENDNELNEKQNESQLNENQLNDKENDNQFKDKENETQFKDKENENELNEKQNANQLNENQFNISSNDNENPNQTQAENSDNLAQRDVKIDQISNKSENENEDLLSESKSNQYSKDDGESQLEKKGDENVEETEGHYDHMDENEIEKIENLVEFNDSCFLDNESFSSMFMCSPHSNFHVFDKSASDKKQEKNSNFALPPFCDSFLLNDEFNTMNLIPKETENSFGSNLLNKAKSDEVSAKQNTNKSNKTKFSENKTICTADEENENKSTYFSNELDYNLNKAEFNSNFNNSNLYKLNSNENEFNLNKSCSHNDDDENHNEKISNLQNCLKFDSYNNDISSQFTSCDSTLYNILFTQGNEFFIDSKSDQIDLLKADESSQHDSMRTIPTNFNSLQKCDLNDDENDDENDKKGKSNSLFADRSTNLLYGNPAELYGFTNDFGDSIRIDVNELSSLDKNGKIESGNKFDSRIPTMNDYVFPPLTFLNTVKSMISKKSEQIGIFDDSFQLEESCPNENKITNNEYSIKSPMHSSIIEMTSKLICDKVNDPDFRAEKKSGSSKFIDNSFSDTEFKVMSSLTSQILRNERNLSDDFNCSTSTSMKIQKEWFNDDFNIKPVAKIMDEDKVFNDNFKPRSLSKFEQKADFGNEFINLPLSHFIEPMNDFKLRLEYRTFENDKFSDSFKSVPSNEAEFSGTTDNLINFGDFEIPSLDATIKNGPFNDDFKCLQSFVIESENDFKCETDTLFACNDESDFKLIEKAMHSETKEVFDENGMFHCNVGDESNKPINLQSGEVNYKENKDDSNLFISESNEEITSFNKSFFVETSNFLVMNNEDYQYNEFDSISLSEFDRFLPTMSDKCFGKISFLSSSIPNSGSKQVLDFGGLKNKIENEVDFDLNSSKIDNKVKNSSFNVLNYDFDKNLSSENEVLTLKDTPSYLVQNSDLKIGENNFYRDENLPFNCNFDFVDPIDRTADFEAKVEASSFICNHAIGEFLSQSGDKLHTQDAIPCVENEAEAKSSNSTFELEVWPSFKASSDSFIDKLHTNPLIEAYNDKICDFPISIYQTNASLLNPKSIKNERINDLPSFIENCYKCNDSLPNQFTCDFSFINCNTFNCNKDASSDKDFVPKNIKDLVAFSNNLENVKERSINFAFNDNSESGDFCLPSINDKRFDELPFIYDSKSFFIDRSFGLNAEEDEENSDGNKKITKQENLDFSFDANEFLSINTFDLIKPKTDESKEFFLSPKRKHENKDEEKINKETDFVSPNKTEKEFLLSPKHKGGNKDEDKINNEADLVSQYEEENEFLVEKSNKANKETDHVSESKTGKDSYSSPKIKGENKNIVPISSIKARKDFSSKETSKDEDKVNKEEDFISQNQMEKDFYLSPKHKHESKDDDKVNKETDLDSRNKEKEFFVSPKHKHESKDEDKINKETDANSRNRGKDFFVSPKHKHESKDDDKANNESDLVSQNKSSKEFFMSPKRKHESKDEDKTNKEEDFVSRNKSENEFFVTPKRKHESKDEDKANKEEDLLSRNKAENEFFMSPKNKHESKDEDKTNKEADFVSPNKSENEFFVTPKHKHERKDEDKANKEEDLLSRNKSENEFFMSPKNKHESKDEDKTNKEADFVSQNKTRNEFLVEKTNKSIKERNLVSPDKISTKNKDEVIDQEDIKSDFSGQNKDDDEDFSLSDDHESFFTTQDKSDLFLGNCKQHYYSENLDYLNMTYDFNCRSPSFVHSGFKSEYFSALKEEKMFGRSIEYDINEKRDEEKRNQIELPPIIDNSQHYSLLLNRPQSSTNNKGEFSDENQTNSVYQRGFAPVNLLVFAKEVLNSETSKKSQAIDDMQDENDFNLSFEKPNYRISDDHSEFDSTKYSIDRSLMQVLPSVMSLSKQGQRTQFVLTAKDLTKDDTNQFFTTPCFICDNVFMISSKEREVKLSPQEEEEEEKDPIEKRIESCILLSDRVFGPLQFKWPGKEIKSVSTCREDEFSDLPKLVPIDVAKALAINNNEPEKESISERFCSSENPFNDQFCSMKMISKEENYRIKIEPGRFVELPSLLSNKKLNGSAQDSFNFGLSKLNIQTGGFCSNSVSSSKKIKFIEEIFDENEFMVDSSMCFNTIKTSFFLPEKEAVGTTSTMNLLKERNNQSKVIYDKYSFATNPSNAKIRLAKNISSPEKEGIENNSSNDLKIDLLNAEKNPLYSNKVDMRKSERNPQASLTVDLKNAERNQQHSMKVSLKGAEQNKQNSMKVNSINFQRNPQHSIKVSLNDSERSPLHSLTVDLSESERNPIYDFTVNSSSSEKNTRSKAVVDIAQSEKSKMHSLTNSIESEKDVLKDDEKILGEELSTSKSGELTVNESPIPEKFRFIDHFQPSLQSYVDSKPMVTLLNESEYNINNSAEFAVINELNFGLLSHNNMIVDSKMSNISSEEIKVQISDQKTPTEDSFEIPSKAFRDDILSIKKVTSKPIYLCTKDKLFDSFNCSSFMSLNKSSFNSNDTLLNEVSFNRQNTSLQIENSVDTQEFFTISTIFPMKDNSADQSFSLLNSSSDFILAQKKRMESSKLASTTTEVSSLLVSNSLYKVTCPINPIMDQLDEFRPFVKPGAKGFKRSRDPGFEKFNITIFNSGFISYMNENASFENNADNKKAEKRSPTRRINCSILNNPSDLLHNENMPTSASNESESTVIFSFEENDENHPIKNNSFDSDNQFRNASKPKNQTSAKNINLKTENEIESTIENEYNYESESMNSINNSENKNDERQKENSSVAVVKELAKVSYSKAIPELNNDNSLSFVEEEKILSEDKNDKHLSDLSSISNKYETPSASIQDYNKNDKNKEETQSKTTEDNEDKQNEEKEENQLSSSYENESKEEENKANENEFDQDEEKETKLNQANKLKQDKINKTNEAKEENQTNENELKQDEEENQANESKQNKKEVQLKQGNENESEKDLDKEETRQRSNNTNESRQSQGKEETQMNPNNVLNDLSEDSEKGSRIKDSADAFNENEDNLNKNSEIENKEKVDKLNKDGIEKTEITEEEESIELSSGSSDEQSRESQRNENEEVDNLSIDSSDGNKETEKKGEIGQLSDDLDDEENKEAKNKEVVGKEKSKSNDDSLENKEDETANKQANIVSDNHLSQNKLEEEETNSELEQIENIEENQVNKVDQSESIKDEKPENLPINQDIQNSVNNEESNETISNEEEDEGNQIASKEENQQDTKEIFCIENQITNQKEIKNLAENQTENVRNDKTISSKNQFVDLKEEIEDGKSDQSENRIINEDAKSRKQEEDSNKADKVEATNEEDKENDKQDEILDETNRKSDEEKRKGENPSKASANTDFDSLYDEGQQIKQDEIKPEISENDNLSLHSSCEISIKEEINGNNSDSSSISEMLNRQDSQISLTPISSGFFQKNDAPMHVKYTKVEYKSEDEQNKAKKDEQNQPQNDLSKSQDSQKNPLAGEKSKKQSESKNNNKNNIKVGKRKNKNHPIKFRPSMTFDDEENIEEIRIPNKEEEEENQEEKIKQNKDEENRKERRKQSKDKENQEERIKQNKENQEERIKQNKDKENQEERIKQNKDEENSKERRKRNKDKENIQDDKGNKNEKENAEEFPEEAGKDEEFCFEITPKPTKRAKKKKRNIKKITVPAEVSGKHDENPNLDNKNAVIEEEDEDEPVPEKSKRIKKKKKRNIKKIAIPVEINETYVENPSFDYQINIFEEEDEEETVPEKPKNRIRKRRRVRKNPANPAVNKPTAEKPEEEENKEIPTFDHPLVEKVDLLDDTFRALTPPNPKVATSAPKAMPKKKGAKRKSKASPENRSNKKEAEKKPKEAKVLETVENAEEEELSSGALHDSFFRKLRNDLPGHTINDLGGAVDEKTAENRRRLCLNLEIRRNEEPQKKSPQHTKSSGQRKSPSPPRIEVPTVKMTEGAPPLPVPPFDDEIIDSDDHHRLLTVGLKPKSVKFSNDAIEGNADVQNWPNLNEDYYQRNRNGKSRKPRRKREEVEGEKIDRESSVDSLCNFIKSPLQNLQLMSPHRSENFMRQLSSNAARLSGASSPSEKVRHVDYSIFYESIIFPISIDHAEVAAMIRPNMTLDDCLVLAESFIEERLNPLKSTSIVFHQNVDRNGNFLEVTLNGLVRTKGSNSTPVPINEVTYIKKGRNLRVSVGNEILLFHTNEAESLTSLIDHKRFGAISVLNECELQYDREHRDIFGVRKYKKLLESEVESDVDDNSDSFIRSDVIISPNLYVPIVLLNSPHFPLRLVRDLFDALVAAKLHIYTTRALFLAEAANVPLHLIFKRSSKFSRPLMLIFIAYGIKWIRNLVTSLVKMKVVQIERFIKILLKAVEKLPDESFFILRSIVTLSFFTVGNGKSVFFVLLSFLSRVIREVIKVTKNEEEIDYNGEVMSNIQIIESIQLLFSNLIHQLELMDKSQKSSFSILIPFLSSILNKTPDLNENEKKVDLRKTKRFIEDNEKEVEYNLMKFVEQPKSKNIMAYSFAYNFLFLSDLIE